MHPHRQLVDLYRSGGAGVLYTAVTGEATGSRMLALHNGECAGHTLLVEDPIAQQETFVFFHDTGELLREDAFTADAAALIDAIKASLLGDGRTIVTVLPATDQPLQRFIMDTVSDVVFATDSLDTEDIVPLRRIARAAPHASLHPIPQGRMFVEVLQPFKGETVQHRNDSIGGG